MINECENVRNTFLRNVGELLHGVTSEKIVFFIVTAVRTSVSEW
jgi:hypothetical protein